MTRRWFASLAASLILFAALLPPERLFRLFRILPPDAAVSARGQGISPGSTGRILYGPTVPGSCVTARGEVFFHTVAPNVGAHECIANVYVYMAAVTGTVSSFNTRTGAVTLTSGDVTTALTFTPENVANKNGASGYAGLSGGKVALAQISEVLGVVDLTSYSAVSGSGSTALAATLSGLAANDVLTWSGTNWVNAPAVQSFNTRAGAVTLTNGDVAELLSVTDLSTYASASGTGTAALRATISSPATNDVLTWNGTNWINQVAGGGGITTLNTLTGATQTFATGTAGTDFGISSSGSTHTFNIPSASATNRGLVTTGSQTFAGAKTLSGGLTVTSGGVNLNTGTTFNVSGSFNSNVAYLDTPGGNNEYFYTQSTKVFAAAANRLWCWTGTNDGAQASADTCLERNAAGVVGVDNGTAGTMRDFTWRNLIGSGQGSHINQSAANSDIAGAVTITAATSAAKTFTTPYTSAPSCTLTPTSDPGVTNSYWVSTSTTAVTANVSVSATITFNYRCTGNPN